MAGVSGPTATGGVVRGAGTPGPAPAGTPGLLPTPSTAPCNTSEAITQILRMSSQISEQQALVGKGQVEVAQAQRTLAAARRREALDRAIEAARKARESSGGGGLFSFVTDRIGLVGLVGLATMNFSLVGADVAAHASGLTKGSTHGLDLGAALMGGPIGYVVERAACKLLPEDFEKTVEQLGTVEDDEVRVANKVALTIALAAAAAVSTVLTCGTAAPALVALSGIGVSTATQVAAETGALKEAFGDKAAAYIALGGCVTGAALSLGGSIASVASAGSTAATTASEASKAAVETASEIEKDAKVAVRALGAATTIERGASKVIEGVADLRRADARYDADVAKIDAKAEQNLLARIERALDEILEDIKNAKESSRRAAELLTSTLEVHHQTLLTAGSMRV